VGTDRRPTVGDDRNPIGPLRDGHPFRLAFAIERYFEFGGLQRDMLRIALRCVERGHQVHILTGDWVGARPENVQVQLLPLRSRTNHGRVREFGKAVGERVQRDTFDCLVGFNKMAGLDVYWAGDPCLAERLRERRLPFVRWLPRYRAYLELEEAVMGHGSAAELLILAEPEIQKIARHYGTPESQMHVLPPGIDRRRFEGSCSEPAASTAIRRELGIGPNELMILTVGSSFKTKGVDRALLALAGLKPRDQDRAHLVVVGKGDAAPLQRLARRLRLAERVHFTGGRDDVARFYRAADFLLHPARTETAGHTLIEALVCELPVLVTANCGYAIHIRRAAAGLVCPHPFVQRNLNRLLEEMLSAEARLCWKENAAAYCRTTDLYSLVDRAVDVIVARAARNRRLSVIGGAPLDHANREKRAA